MSVERAKEHLEKLGMADKIKIFDQSSATVELAAQALGCEPARIAKSLTFMVDGAAVMVIAAGDMRVDNGKYKAQFGTKAKMLSPAEVDELIGHSIGGVCPFGINEGVRVFLDESLKRFEVVFPACGGSNTAVELTLAELEKASGFEQWVDVCKAPNKEG